MQKIPNAIPLGFYFFVLTNNLNTATVSLCCRLGVKCMCVLWYWFCVALSYTECSVDLLDLISQDNSTRKSQVVISSSRKMTLGKKLYGSLQVLFLIRDITISVWTIYLMSYVNFSKYFHKVQKYFSLFFNDSSFFLYFSMIRAVCFRKLLLNLLFLPKTTKPNLFKLSIK